MKTNIKGILAAAVVPYNDMGEITDVQLEKLYGYLIDGGVSGLFIGGSTGEWPLLKMSERKQIAKKAVEVSAGQVPVIVNISSLITDEIQEYANFAKEIGASAVSVIAPFYFSYDNAGLEKYFSSALECTDLPTLLYNIPSNVKNSISPALFRKLALKYDHVVGIKDSSMDFMTYLEYSESKPDGLGVYMGNDGQILSSLEWGGAGAVAATASIFPKTVTEIYRRFTMGDLDGAREVQRRIIALRSIIRSYPPVAVHKAALNMQGIEVGVPRTPLRSLTEQEISIVRSQLEQLQLL